MTCEYPSIARAEGLGVAYWRHGLIWHARQGEAVWWVRTTTIKPQSFEIPLSELLPIHSTLQTVIKVGMYRTSEKCMHSTERKEHRLGGYVPLSSSSAAILNISAAS